MNRKPFGVGEWYHCYSRGVDKRRTFQSAADYKRFLQLLYIANTEKPFHFSNVKLPHEKVFQIDRGKSLVSVGAYALMPNHFHLLLQEVNENGIARFMQKLGTAYGMYFNKKYERVGNLFVKPFRSKHIDSDAYLRRVAQYIHVNPVEIFEPEWKKGKAGEIKLVEKRLLAYPYSSLPFYLGSAQSERVILCDIAMSTISSEMPSLQAILKDESEYQKELAL